MLMYVEDTIVAAATPAGTGGVAIVRISGPRTFEVLHKIWHPQRTSALEPRRLYLGDVIDPDTGARIDRALAVVFPTPASLTGEDVAELQCHGGIYLVKRVIALAMACGARMAEAGEFSRRAFLNGRMDLTEAEAIADLVEARSEAALKQALAQMTGVLREKIRGLREQLIGVRAHLEAHIDFSDEDIGLPSMREIASDIERVSSETAILHASFARGRLVREGVCAAIIGRPNVGKSSILNLILGTERAIVTAIPGTTRDVIEESLRLGPYPLVVQDTAGIRESSDEIERIGIERTRRSAAEADLVVAVFDGSQPLADEDREVAQASRGRAGVALLNKSDLTTVVSADDLRAIGVELPLLRFSARTAQGLDSLRTELARGVESVAGPARGEDVAISRERHRDALAHALDALAAARGGALSGMPPEIVAIDLARATDALGWITGEIHTEDILDAVFRQFCIGK